MNYKIYIKFGRVIKVGYYTNIKKSASSFGFNHQIQFKLKKSTCHLLKARQLLKFLFFLVKMISFIHL